MSSINESLRTIQQNADKMFKEHTWVNTDIIEHLPTLYKYAKECTSIIECGVRNCVSSYPLIKGLLENSGINKKMVSVDVYKSEGMKHFEGLAKQLINFEFFEGSDLIYPIKGTYDLVFIDTLHVCGQLRRELKKYAPHTAKYIIMHDTTVDEFVGEVIRNNWDANKISKENGFTLKETLEGLWPAIMEFLEENKNWHIKERFKNNNGLTILERIGNIEIKDESKIKVVEEPKIQVVEETKIQVVEEPKIKVVEEPKIQVVEEIEVKIEEEPKIQVVKEIKLEPKIEVVEETKDEPKLLQTLQDGDIKETSVPAILKFSDIKKASVKNISRIIEVMSSNDCKNTAILTLGGLSTVFTEITSTLQRQLIDEGILCKVVKDRSEIGNSETLYIIFNAHQEITPIPDNLKYVIFNYEQAGSNYIKYPEYITKMKKGVALFDYSYYNKDILEKLTGREVDVIPFSYHKSLTVLEPNINNKEDVDVLFYGCMNANRKIYADILKNTKYNVKFVTNYTLFGDMLHAEWKKTKIVLNLHYYTKPSVLELSRILPLISNHKLVFSERSDDVSADKRFEEMVVFITPETIIAELDKYLGDDNLRTTQVEKAFNLLKSEI